MRTIIFFFLLLILGCSQSPKEKNASQILSDLQRLSYKETQSKFPAGSKIRIQALEETAMILGAQTGLAWQAEKINEKLQGRKRYLDQIFNFNPLILENSVLPPVLVRSDKSLNLNSSRILRISDNIYQIEKQARFVTASPTWRDYLWLNFKYPGTPDATLLPKNSEERALWIKFINKGWEKGISLANRIYQTNLAKLKRDYNGILLYRELLSKNMVTEPFVVKTDLGIVSNKDKSQIYIGDRILRIQTIPKLTTDPDKWQPKIIYANEQDREDSKKSATTEIKSDKREEIIFYE